MNLQFKVFTILNSFKILTVLGDLQIYRQFNSKERLNLLGDQCDVRNMKEVELLILCQFLI